MDLPENSRRLRIHSEAMGYRFDPYGAAFRDDPYAVYEEMRQTEPVSRQDDWQLTFFTRHRDVHKLLRDRRLGRDIIEALGTGVLDHRELPSAYPNWSHFVRRLAFLEREGDFHARMRGLVAKAFTKGRVEALRPALEATCDRLLDRLEEAGTGDLIADYATPVPLITICELLGVDDPEDRALLIPWSHAIVGLYELDATLEMGEEAESATIEFVAFVRRLIDERRSRPGDDLLSALIEVEEADQRLTDDEIIGTTILLLNAGHEATVHAIGNAVAALLEQRDQLEALRAEPGLLPGGIEELLRFDTPLQMFERWVLEDFEYEGVELPARSKIGLLMGAANRDPARFPSPDSLDVRRDARAHVSFGGGVHLCLGAPLARLEMVVAIGRLIERFPNLERTADPARRDSFIFRGFELFQITV
jgi:cytochrome P450